MRDAKKGAASVAPSLNELQDIRYALGPLLDETKPLPEQIKRLVHDLADLRQACAGLERERATRREEFSAFALVGLMASPARWRTGGKKVTTPEGYAQVAFRIADAMMAARGKS